MIHAIDIRKENGRWMVIRPDPRKKYHRGQDLKWVLHPDPDAPQKPVSAHFQFTDVDLVEDLDKNFRLTSDMTAEIPEAGKHLTLKVKQKACRRKNPRYYAVWIRDSDFPAGGVFAVGESGNPPPEMDVGGP